MSDKGRTNRVTDPTVLTTGRVHAARDEARAPRVVDTADGRLTPEQAADPTIRGQWDPDLWCACAVPTPGGTGRGRA